MDLTRFAVKLCAPLPSLTGIPNLGNDRLAVRVGHLEAITLVRVLPPSYGLVMEALELGLVEPLNLQQPVAEVLSLLAAAEGGCPHGLLPRLRMDRPRHLVRLK